MLTFRPRSIKQLTATGFLVVAGTLIIALVITARQINGLGEQNQFRLRQSAQAMDAVRIITEQASALERNARQYQIVGDREILMLYQDRRSVLHDAAQQLQRLEIDPAMNLLVNTLLANEQANFQHLSDRAGLNSAGLIPPMPLLDPSYQLSSQLGYWTSAQLQLIQSETESTQRWLLLQAMLLSIAALLFSGLFTILITRPLVQIKQAISQLGSGAYDTAIAVKGPEDLVTLGTSLDWLRSRLKSLEQQRSSFLRHVSHELKTPLAAIQESAALIQDGVAGTINEEQRKLLSILSSNGQRLQLLIEDLLRYHSEILSVLNAMPHPVRLDRIIDTVLTSHDFVIQSGRLTILKDLQIATVSGDAEQLRVIVDNLVTNAIKFSPENGHIEIRLARHGGNIILDVIDSGPGISITEKDKIFEAFYQGSANARNFFKGSGLGLAIVQEYTNANRGSIEALECAQGAHFRLQFPAEPDSP